MYSITTIVFNASNADPDQTQPSTACDLGLHCLHGVSRLKFVSLFQCSLVPGRDVKVLVLKRFARGTILLTYLVCFRTAWELPQRQVSYLFPIPVSNRE